MGMYVCVCTYVCVSVCVRACLSVRACKCGERGWVGLNDD